MRVCQLDGGRRSPAEPDDRLLGGRQHRLRVSRRRDRPVRQWLRFGVQDEEIRLERECHVGGVSDDDKIVRTAGDHGRHPPMAAVHRLVGAPHDDRVAFGGQDRRQHQCADPEAPVAVAPAPEDQQVGFPAGRGESPQRGFCRDADPHRQQGKLAGDRPRGLLVGAVQHQELVAPVAGMACGPVQRDLAPPGTVRADRDRMTFHIPTIAARRRRRQCRPALADGAQGPLCVVASGPRSGPWSRCRLGRVGPPTASETATCQGMAHQTRTCSILWPARLAAGR
jgi:hypothetical protein